MGVLFPFMLYTTPEMVTLAHGADALALVFWTLRCLVSRGMAPLEMISDFFLVGGGFGSDSQVVLRFGLWRNIPWRHGLVASGSPSGSCLEG